MLRLKPVIAAIALLLLSSLIQANEFDPAQSAALKRGLAQHPVWLQLLEYSEGGAESEIESEEFFLTPAGKSDPRAELIASIAAFSEPAETDKADRHAQCRFPARYFWLAQQLPELATVAPAIRCRAVENWIKADQFRSVSVIMVSGFYGSPAASFGHALIKLNNGEQALKRGLLDKGANFGAVIPAEDSLPTYVYKGLFGHYHGGFGNSNFYLQDRLYARVQSRDMWEYELELPEDKQRLLALHLWEVTGKIFRYFFLRQNCAYRIARLLELGIGESLTTTPHRPYPPSLLFHQLALRNEQSEKPLIRQIRHIPSPKRILSDRFKKLTPVQRRQARQFIKSGGSEEPLLLTGADQIAVSDALLDYYNYQLALEGNETDENLRQANQAALKLRLKQAADIQQAALSTPEPYAPPSQGTRPIRFGIGSSHSDQASDVISLQATLFDNALLSRNGPLGSMLRIADIEMRHSDERALYLNRLAIGGAQNLRHIRASFPGESRLAWRLGAALQQKSLACNTCLEFEARGGAGSAFISQHFSSYFMADALLASRDEALGLSPAIGLLLGQPKKFSMALEAAYRFHPGGEDNDADFSATAALPVSPQTDLRFSWREYQDSEWALTFSAYW